jgi:hypothetical protein
MPGTRRFPIKRQHSMTITATLPAFRHALRARAKAARSGSAKDREQASEAERVVDRSLGTRLWQVSIWDIIGDGNIYRRDRPPQEVRHHDSWATAVAQLQALEQADREQRRQERAARRAAKAVAEQREPEPVA